ncbi:Noc2 domain containing protein [Trichuris trichiura]|uniref:Noc2 domain containing protein n=1 Tax=Trichuris trichiura TaxID=36087 RepID=A0A077Z449_TRITR|nr:Noc2 domain containing protein [Trichuris trichiura]
MLKATLEHLTNLTHYYGLLPRTSKMLLRDTFAEVCLLNPRLTYRHAFLFIRQLAISLRNATISKTEKSAKLVQSWQFVQSVLLWCRVLATCSNEIVLQPIRYPLIHVAFGCARYLRNQFLKNLHNTLCLVNFNHKPKRSTLKPIDFDCSLKLSNAHLLESSFRLTTMGRVVEYMQRFFYINRRSVSFPELAFPVLEAVSKNGKPFQLSFKMIMRFS